MSLCPSHSATTLQVLPFAQRDIPMPWTLPGTNIFTINLLLLGVVQVFNQPILPTLLFTDHESAGETNRGSLSRVAGEVPPDHSIGANHSTTVQGGGTAITERGALSLSCPVFRVPSKVSELSEGAWEINAGK